MRIMKWVKIVGVNILHLQYNPMQYKYYSTFAFENINQFRDWSRQHQGGRQGDKAELLFLFHSQEFTEFFADCKQNGKGVDDNKWW